MAKGVVDHHFIACRDRCVGVCITPEHSSVELGMPSTEG